MYRGSINHREYWNVIERSVDRMRGPRRYLLSFYLLGLTMNQLGASLLNNVETLFIQTVNRPGTRGGGLISDTESVRCRARIGESAYFRVYIPPIQEFITLDSTEIYRIRNRLEGRGNIRRFDSGFQLDDLNSRSTRSFVGWLCLSLSLSARITRGLFHRGRGSIDRKIGGARAFSASSLFIFASFK